MLENEKSLVLMNAVYYNIIVMKIQKFLYFCFLSHLKLDC